MCVIAFALNFWQSTCIFCSICSFRISNPISAIGCKLGYSIASFGANVAVIIPIITIIIITSIIVNAFFILISRAKIIICWARFGLI